MAQHTPLNRLIQQAAIGALLVGGLTMVGSAMAQPQGLYSTDELIGSDVYATSSSDRIGDVEDILLDNDMQVRALVIDTGTLLDFKGEQQFVIETGKFTVETRDGNNLEAVAYRVNVDMSEEQITQQPQYTNAWWQNAREGAQQAWEDTKEGAASAWETTQEGASTALDRIGQALEKVGERTREAADRSSE